MNKYVWGVGVLVVLGLIVLWRMPVINQEAENTGAEKQKVTVYKSPDCGCCIKHSATLREHGFEVDMVLTEDMAAIKDKYGISSAMESCHTAVIGDYFVEGHVPMEAIDKLLAERPDIDGIALPGMPAGSPGMPGIKIAPFEIFGIKGGVVSEFLTI